MDPYKCFMVETMHTAELGLFFHVRKCIEEFYVAERQGNSILKTMDERLSILRRDLRIQYLKLRMGNYWYKGKQLTATEHTAVFEVSVALAASLFRPEHVTVLRHLMDWHKCARLLKYTASDLRALNESAIRCVPSFCLLCVCQC